MHRSYRDILSRIKDEPLWWDENAVPRYEPFSPNLMGIYANEVCLFEIACQGCGRIFKVASYGASVLSSPRLMDQIESRCLNFGDPPNVGCCIAGASMSCLNLRVLEYWILSGYLTRKEDSGDWIRMRNLELLLPDYNWIYGDYYENR